MSAKDDGMQFSSDELPGFVPLVFARSGEDAERLRDLLADHDVPASVGTDEDVPLDEEATAKFFANAGRGIPVLVPQVLLDEAQEIIADIEDADEFAIEGEQVEQEDDDALDLEETIGPAEESVEDDDNLVGDIDEDDGGLGDDMEEEF